MFGGTTTGWKNFAPDQYATGLGALMPGGPSILGSPTGGAQLGQGFGTPINYDVLGGGSIPGLRGYTPQPQPFNPWDTGTRPRGPNEGPGAQWA